MNGWYHSFRWLGDVWCVVIPEKSSETQATRVIKKVRRATFLLELSTKTTQKKIQRWKFILFCVSRSLLTRSEIKLIKRKAQMFLHQKRFKPRKIRFRFWWKRIASEGEREGKFAEFRQSEKDFLVRVMKTFSFRQGSRVMQAFGCVYTTRELVRLLMDSRKTNDPKFLTFSTQARPGRGKCFKFSLSLSPALLPYWYTTSG